MVDIKEMSREFTKVEKYLMTTAPDIEPLKISLTASLYQSMDLLSLMTSKITEIYRSL